MSFKIWEASKRTKKNSELFSFEKFVSIKLKKKFNSNYEKFHDWSVKDSKNFWNIFWDFTKIKGLKGKRKFKKSKVFHKNIFLPRSKLNFAENLLSKNNEEKAITFISENGYRETRNWNELNQNVSKIIKFLKKIKIKKKR